jgi:hypothetical protein
MTIVPKDLQGISSYQVGALRLQHFDTEQRQKIRWLSLRPPSLTA